MKEFVKGIFTASNGKPSIKRVLAAIGFIACIVMVATAMLYSFEIPTLADDVLYISGALAGLGSITTAISNRGKDK